MISHEQRARVESWPPFTDDPVDRLRHTLSAFEECGDTQRVLTASYGVLHPGAGPQSWSGITYGDLRAILARYDRAMAMIDGIDEPVRLTNGHGPMRRIVEHGA